ncbi:MULTISPECIES: thioredoxin family protein [unclassified Pseudomonas]|uniref:thioredoxin family protein n=1 Tax=unclassified Pseudomonas TaxID=196821 RepID=UPI002096B42B|nr:MULTISPECIES: thioredoxin family protein [unclassified Pseudomonas]MCO7520001.1 thioredoxin family protein [Pseudomonas sp. 1]MCO7540980.1 thioredoxin family protein [Pseudomonas sp. VA159-2]
MAMVSLTDLLALVELLTQDHPKPTLLLIHSDQCPPCKQLYPKLVKLAKQGQDYEFHSFNVDICDPHWMNCMLTLLFNKWGVKYLPTQVLLASGKDPKVLATTKIETIEHELALLKKPTLAA